MKYILVLFLLLGARCLAFNDDAFLHAIATVETNCDNSAVGKAGERSQYQFMRATWDQYSRISHAKCAQHPAEIERVAKTHLIWIKERLTKNGMTVNVENCAAIWNAGWGNYRKGFRPHKYIQKVKANYRE